jgi:hypothetical protein
LSIQCPIEVTGLETSKQFEPLEAVATNTVLQRLGQDVYEIVKFHLARYHNIKLDQYNRLSCNIVELGAAMQKLIGSYAAELIIQEIYVELDELASK